jgi:hypothetical protein
MFPNSSNLIFSRILSTLSFFTWTANSSVIYVDYIYIMLNLISINIKIQVRSSKTFTGSFLSIF